MHPLHTIFLAQDRVADLHRAVDPHVGEYRASRVAGPSRLARFAATVTMFGRWAFRSNPTVVR